MLILWGAPPAQGGIRILGALVWSRPCDHAAAIPAVLRVLRASGSVLRQSVGHSSCMQRLVRTVQNCAADLGDLTGTVLVDAPVAVQPQVFVFAQRLARQLIHVLRQLHQSTEAFWKNFTLSYAKGDSRILRSISSCSPRHSCRTTEKCAQMLFSRDLAHLADICSLCEFCH